MTSTGLLWPYATVSRSMSDGTKTEGTEMTEAADTSTSTETGTETSEQQEQGKTFTQAEVDQMINQRAERIARQRYSDYDDLKSKAAVSQTLEERLAGVESELTATKASALRTRIAAKYGISTEGEKDSPSDADLILTGTDEATLTAQAQRFAGRREEQKQQQSNVAPNEGGTKKQGKGDDGLREFTRDLFNQPD